MGEVRNALVDGGKNSRDEFLPLKLVGLVSSSSKVCVSLGVDGI